VNLITRLQEPYIPFLKGKLPHIIVSTSLVLLCITLAFGIMGSIIAYRISVKLAINSSDSMSAKLQIYGPILTSLTAAFINLICILAFNQIYMRLAFYLTEREMPRTVTEFDNSLTLKMYLFQFVNYYSSIFYIAFFKGKFVGHPGEPNIAIAEQCPTGL
jgi:anoctamin-1